MGDVVGDILHALHEQLDTIEHVIEVVGQTVELVAVSGNRQAA